MVCSMIKIVKEKLFLAFILVIGISSSQAQLNKAKTTQTDKNWFIGFDYGLQMSGIKKEDFISSNYSPVVRLSLGKWISQNIAIKVGYQGRYFNTIADDIRHYYNFYYTEAVFDVKNILFKKKEKKIHELLLHIGPGYFDNFEYDRGNIHGIIGASNNFSIMEKFKLSLDISAIIGWDIYQGNDDILPNLSFGLVYEF